VCINLYALFMYTGSERWKKYTKRCGEDWGI